MKNDLNKTARSGGEILVAQLLKQGVDRVFCVPGESYLAVLDALYDTDIQIIICRQEGGAAMMAEAYAKLSGKPGVCMVTRAPGATNAYAGVHIANQDSTPLILLVGQIDTGMRERKAFQEMDYHAVFGDQSKWATEIDDVERIPELMSRAFHIATAGNPGPVVIALPENMLVQRAEVQDAPTVKAIPLNPSQQQIESAISMLQKADNPILLAGGSRWSKNAVDELIKFADKSGIPVAVEFRRQMLFPHSHPCYAGDVGLGINPKLVQRLKDSDCIMLVGGSMSEVPSQSYTLLNIPKAAQSLIHVHPDIHELNRVYQADLAVNSTAEAWLQGLNQAAALTTLDRKWHSLSQTAHEDYLAWTDPSKNQSPGDLTMAHIMTLLREKLPKDSIMCNGAGNYATWLHRYYRFEQYGTQLAPTSGSMGYGLPAAVAAKQYAPDKTVICFAGDGCFMMHGQEFATAIQYDLPIVVLIFDNGMYGTIRMHQERDYPDRVSGTYLKNPDFAAYAKAFGGHGERVERNEEFEAAFERAIDSGKPAIIHCLMNPEAITPDRTLSQIRDSSKK